MFPYFCTRIVRYTKIIRNIDTIDKYCTWTDSLAIQSVIINSIQWFNAGPMSWPYIIFTYIQINKLECMFGILE